MGPVGTLLYRFLPKVSPRNPDLLDAPLHTAVCLVSKDRVGLGQIIQLIRAIAVILAVMMAALLCRCVRKVF